MRQQQVLQISILTKNLFLFIEKLLAWNSATLDQFLGRNNHLLLHFYFRFMLSDLIKDFLIIIVMNRFTVMFHHIPSLIWLEIIVWFQIFLMVSPFSFWIDYAINELPVPSMTPRFWIQWYLSLIKNGSVIIMRI